MPHLRSAGRTSQNAQAMCIKVTTAPTPSMSTTQDGSVSKPLTSELVLPKTTQLGPPPDTKVEKVVPAVPTQTTLSVTTTPALPVPAKPPTIPSNKFTVLAPSGRRSSLKTLKKSSGTVPSQRSARMGTQSSTTTRTLLSMSSSASQSTKTGNSSKQQTRKVKFWL
ncbi:hypothetical protein DICVIV_08338 [Dictyocaulus viviparus]|uniref:Uncharacterized protein n=1 Tax=Dictyocaulus viviparus TaxID=29172 RepID=A0A0D8XPC3_DICVI|nr:hypothetical protein DICVIV_08338 [Dictyocaulus viviparus]